jgi:serine/threonine-protein kinase
LFLDVLGAVAHAHGQLIVHRDLKPSNILVTHDCVVKLLDFGVAALLSPSLLHAARLTHEYAAGFTPEYAAPEQLRGEPVTVATDIYTLGVLLFVLLTGQFPVDRKGKSVAQLQHLSDEAEAPRPSDVAADANAQRLLRGDLDNILLNALHTDARRRYSTVDHFAEDLRHYLTHEPVSARPRAWTYVAAKFARRHRIGVVAATAVLLVVVGAVVVTTQLLLVARYQRDQAWYQSRRAELSIDFMGQLLRYGRGADRMLVDLAENYRADGEIARADALFAKAYEMGKESSDAELMVLAQCHRAAADVSLGIHDGAAERIEEAQRLLARMRNPDATPRVDCLLAQATRESSRRRYASAETLLRQAQRMPRSSTSLPLSSVDATARVKHFGRYNEQLQ